jgi:hypothetical protein
VKSNLVMRPPEMAGVACRREGSIASEALRDAAEPSTPGAIRMNIKGKELRENEVGTC